MIRNIATAFLKSSRNSLGFAHSSGYGLFRNIPVYSLATQRPGDSHNNYNNYINANKDKLNEAKDKLNQTKDKLKNKKKKKKEDLKDKLNQTKDKLNEKKDDIKDKLNDKKDNLKDKLNQTKDTIKDKLSNVKQEVSEKAGQFKEAVKDATQNLKQKTQDLGQNLKDVKDSVKEKLDNSKNDSQTQLEKQTSSEALENLKKKGWTVTTSGSRVELDKRIDDADVHISFYAKPPASSKATSTTATSISEAEKDQDKEKEPEYSEFTVEIKRPNTGEYLYADYMSREGNVTLGNVNFTKNGGSHRILNRLHRYNQRRLQEKNWSPYQRFAFDPIDEQLFRSMQRYFNSVGVDRELFRTIENYSVVVEPPMLSKWMDDLKSFMRRF